jgi:type I restriction enzyme S subunit
MSAFPKYERYKDSGVEWLGEVPEHWVIEKARYIFRKEERPPGKDDGVVTAYRDGQVTLRSLRRAEGYTMAILEQGYQSVRFGDLVIHGMDAFAGAIGVAEANGKCTPEYSVLTPTRDGVNVHWYAHLLRVMAERGYIHIICPSVRERAPRFRFPKLQDNFLPIPPIAEQDRMVAFLDRKTAEIDALISKKQRQIELLDEQKAILIHRAVTRGLNPDAKLKPSGIEWIGDIPAHWEVRQVRHLFDNLDNRRIPLSSIERGKMTDQLYDYYGASGAIDKVDDYIFDEDLILIAEDGANLVMRNLPLAIHATGKYWVNNHAHILRPREGPIEYWLRALECCDFTTSITGSAQPKLTKDALASCFLACPPVYERKAIVASLNQNREAEEALRAAIAAQIDSLQALRSTIIAHAVTGRIIINKARP